MGSPWYHSDWTRRIELTIPANKIVGPGYNEVAARYKGQADAEAKLAAKVRAGGQGAWGAIPMPPQSQLKDEDIRRLVKWIMSGAKAQ